MDARSQQAMELADHLSNQMFHRFRREVPISELRSFAQPAAVQAAAQWDGRGSFPKYAMQRMRWAVLHGLRRDRRQRQKAVDPGLVRHLAALNAERAAAIAESLGQSSPDPPSAPAPAPAQEALSDFLRGAAAMFTIELDAAGALAIPDANEDVEANVERMRIRRAVAELPPAERAVVERHNYGGETFEEIAEASGTHRATVFSCYIRAREKLRRAFEETA